MFAAVIDDALRRLGVRMLAPIFVAVLPHAALAQDAARGARLYVQLPTVPSCVSCHGPDPSQGRNNLLLAADNPRHLQRALNTVGAMGYLKSLLLDADVADLAAYLGRVASVQAAGSPVAMWPTTVEFGSLAVGGSSPVHQLELRNLLAVPLPLASPRLDGPGAAAFSFETDCAASLAPGATCAVRLRAQPVATGPSAATLVLQSGSIAPWVTGLSVSAPPAAAGVLSVDLPGPTLAFGELAIGESSTREFRLLSHGSAPATLGVTTLTGPGRAAFQLQGDCSTGLVLAPGSGCTMRVRFAPIEPGTASATLQWRSDATNPGTVALDAPTRAAPTTPPPAPTAPPVEPGGSGGGCASGPAVRRVDPLLPFAVLACGIALGCRWRRRAPTSDVTTPSRERHGSFIRPA